MGLKDRPWKLLMITLGVTAMALYLGIDLSDGTFEGRQPISLANRPIRFVMFVITWAFLCAVAVILWKTVRAQWNARPLAQRLRSRAPYDDPSHTRPFRDGN